MKNYYKVIRRESLLRDGTGCKESPETSRLYSELFFFDDEDADETREAYQQACVERGTNGGRISVYSEPRCAGPWMVLPIIAAEPEAA